MTTPRNDTEDYRRRYEASLAAAAAIQAAPVTPLMPLPVLLRVSGQIAAARDQAAAMAKTSIGRLWSATNPYSDDEVADFAQQAAAVLTQAQAAAGRVAAVGQAQQLQSVGIDIGTPAPTLPANVRAPAADISNGRVTLVHRPVQVDYVNDDTAHVTPEDMSTEAIFQRPAETFRWVAAEGNKSGLRWIDDAKTQSSLRIATLVDDNLMLAQRLAQQEVLAQAVDLDKKSPKGPRITGYRRVIHPELSRTGTCGLCIAAASRLYTVEELMPLHTRCKCTIAAVTVAHDPADDANTIDLKQLYGHAGGTSAGHLKRTKYQLDEHGELGPVLVPKRKYKPQTKTGKPYQSSGTPRGELKRRQRALSAR